MAKVLAEPSCNITELDFEENDIGPNGCLALAAAFAQNPRGLRRLKLGENRLGAEALAHLATSLATCSALEYVDLRNTDIGADLVQPVVARLVSGCPSLTFLNLSCNGIGDKGAQVLAKALAANPPLRSLVLEENGIGTHGCTCLALALAHNHNLMKLNLDDNDVGERGLQVLCDMLEKNSSLVGLELSADLANDSLLVQIKMYLQRNRAAQLEQRCAWARVSTLIGFYKHCGTSNPLVHSVHPLIPLIVEMCGGFKRHHSQRDQWRDEQIADLDGFMATTFFRDQVGATNVEAASQVKSSYIGGPNENVDSDLSEGLDSYVSLSDMKARVMASLGLEESQLAAGLGVNDQGPLAGLRQEMGRPQEKTSSGPHRSRSLYDKHTVVRSSVLAANGDSVRGGRSQLGKVGSSQSSTAGSRPRSSSSSNSRTSPTPNSTKTSHTEMSATEKRASRIMKNTDGVPNGRQAGGISRTKIVAPRNATTSSSSKSIDATSSKTLTKGRRFQ
jgi:hypothetical protein